MIYKSFVSSTIKNIAVTVLRQSHTQIKQLPPAEKCIHYNEAEGYYRSSPFEPVEIPNMKIHDYVWQNLPKYEKTIAVVSKISIKY